MKIAVKDMVWKLYIVILGLLGFSVLGQYVLLSVLKFPVLLIEVFYIPLFWRYHRQLGRLFSCRFSRRGILLLFFCLSGILLGICRTGNPALIVEYRSILYLMLACKLAKNEGVLFDLQTVLFLNLLVLFGEFLYVFVFSGSAITSSLNSVAVILSIVSAFILEKYAVAAVAAAFSLFMGVLSGYRISIIVPLAALLGMLLYLLLRSEKTWKKLCFKWAVLFVICIAVVLMVQHYETIVYYIAEKTGMDSFAIFRVTERMRGLFQGDITVSQDTERLALFRYPFTRFFTCIIPRGLIGTEIGEYSLYIDVPLIYLYDIFGSVAALVILFVIVLQLIKHIRPCLSNQSRYRETFWRNKRVAAITTGIMGLLLVVNGTFMVSPYQAIETGLVLGTLFASVPDAEKVSRQESDFYNSSAI